MDELHGKKIVILGAGVEGQSAAAYVRRHGGRADVFDEKDAPFPSLVKYDLIFRSPGVNPNHPRLLEAVLYEREITSTTNYFFAKSPTKNIIGVTGTKGKGTTSTLTYLILQNDGRHAFLGGNIGTPPLDFLDEVREDSWVVLELSSFQLMDAKRSPHIAVVLMTTSEHLDWHASQEEYLLAKAGIVSHQAAADMVVSNLDYPNTRKIIEGSRAKQYTVSLRDGKVKNGAIIENEEIIFVNNGIPGVVCKADLIRLPGKHNRENVLAAVTAAKLAGASDKAVIKSLKSFTGLEHRLELVRELDGVKFYDDSFSTTPETTIAAIQSFEAPKVLILGGSSKNSDFTELAKEIRQNKSIRAIVGIGKEWDRIKNTLQATGYPLPTIIEGQKSMKEIVEAARDAASAGDIVLLSPACASFGMFKNYKDRGEQFKDAVNSL